jgi:4-hydroxythreonine-4-phosphate dehydrogenase
MGDPAGIGPELCLRLLREPEVLAQCVPVIFGDVGVLDRVANHGLPPRHCRTLSTVGWQESPPPGEPVVVDCAAVDVSLVRPGELSAACGRAGFTYVQTAIKAAVNGRLAGVVTAPLHKEALRFAGLPYPGHTEIFAGLTGALRTCMMLRSDALTVSMVTSHVGYFEVPDLLSVARVLDVIELTAQALQLLLQRSPRLGVCGLNPHAGEHGLFGQQEEERYLQPAIHRARVAGLQVEGPLPPDTAFTSGQRERFDAIVCLYHDQGHIPFKMLAFDTGVNVTLGLPIIRTSVDHGTAFDIAWQGIANPQSLYAAIRVAGELAASRHTGISTT